MNKPSFLLFRYFVFKQTKQQLNEGSGGASKVMRRFPCSSLGAVACSDLRIIYIYIYILDNMYLFIYMYLCVLIYIYIYITISNRWEHV